MGADSVGEVEPFREDGSPVTEKGSATREVAIGGCSTSSDAGSTLTEAEPVPSRWLRMKLTFTQLMQHAPGEDLAAKMGYACF